MTTHALATLPVLKATSLAEPPEGMVLVPRGWFEMGSTEGGELEQPVHTVELDAFWMDAAPVTNRAFAELADATGHRTAAEKEGAASTVRARA